MARSGRVSLLSLVAARVLGMTSVVCALAAAGEAHAREPSRVRLVPPLEGPDVTTAGVERDGTRRLISRGIRVALAENGEIAVSDELLPVEKSVVSVELPSRFGGGYLFASTASGRTTLWKSRTWAGKLTAFADIDFDVARIVPGFDRIHLQARRSGEWAALDPIEGKGMDRGGLPASPSYGAMAFADAWFGAVELPVRGTVVSFDAGASFHPLGFDVASIGVDHGAGALTLGGERGLRLLGPDGRLRPMTARPARGRASAAPADKGEPERVAREGAFGRFPLRTAVLRGVPQADGTAIVLSRGALGKIRLEDGRVLSQRARAVSETMECSGARVGKGQGFVCGEPRGKTEIYELLPPLGLELRASFDGPRAVFPSDNGGLVVAGSCAGSAFAEARCIITPKGNSFELSIARYGGRSRVAALSDGRAAVLVPPRGSDEKGSLELIDASGRSHRVPLKLEVDGDAAATVLKAGFWMHGLVEAPVPSKRQRAESALSGWVVSRGSFVGVRVGLNGKLTAGPLARSVETALFSGRSALVTGVSGLAEQTANGGFDWTDAAIPSNAALGDSDGDSDRPKSQAPELEQGCSAVGCVFRRWLRVGWDSDAIVQPLMPPPRAEPTVLPSPGGGRWQLSCYATGEASAQGLPLVARRGYGSEGDVPSPWLPLLDAAAPALGKGRSGVDVGTEADLVQLRAYVEGSSAAFGKDATFQVRVADRFALKNSVWSTLPSQSPWSDFDQVLEAFGLEGGSPSGLRVALDASGSAGVFGMSFRGTTDLYLLEQDRMIRRVANTLRYGFGTMTSAVRVGATFYVATAVDTRTLRVFALEGNAEPRLVGEYRDVPLGSSAAPVLVRMASARRGLGLWARGAGWYVFPIDEQSGQAAPAIEVTARTLSAVPRLCSGDEEGFLLEGSIGLEPIVELTGGAAGGSEVAAQARAVEGRFIVSEDGGVCVRELAAQADRPVRKPFARAPLPALQGQSRNDAPLPLVLTDRGERGRRHAFRCVSSK